MPDTGPSARIDADVAERREESPDLTRRVFETALGAPFTTGNAVTRLRNGDEIFPAMLAAIEGAERSVDLLTYVYWTGDIAVRFARTLAAKASQGVPVRVLLDAFGAAPMSHDLIETMRKGGVDVRWFRPLRRWNLWASTHRTHRKVLVVDGRTGFTGGVGIAQEWCGNARDPSEWRDTHFRVEGHAVRGLRAGFLGNWAEAVAESTPSPAWHLPELEAEDSHEAPRPGEALAQVVRSTAGFGWSDIATLTETAIGLARRSLRIGTAYFAPDEPTTVQLITAARRGVRVEVMLPWPHLDNRVSQLAGAEAIAPLLDAGVSVQVFQPTMYHAKLMLLDEEWCVIGSANFNRRSAQQDDELCLVLHDPALRAVLDADWEEDLARCEPIDLRRWRRRGVLRRLTEKAARLVRSEV